MMLQKGNYPPWLEPHQYQNLPPEKQQELVKKLTFAAHNMSEATRKKLSDSNKLYWIKKKIRQGTFKCSDPEFLLQSFEQPHIVAIHMLAEIQAAIKAAPAKKKVYLLPIYDRIYRTIHGERLRIDSTQISINVDMSAAIDQVYAEIKMASASSQAAEPEMKVEAQKTEQQVEQSIKEIEDGNVQS